MCPHVHTHSLSAFYLLRVGGWLKRYWCVCVHRFMHNVVLNVLLWSLFLFIPACFSSTVNMFALPETTTQMLTVYTHTTLIIKIIHRHRSEIVSKESHLPINYSLKLFLPCSLINSCAATQKEMSSDKWAQDFKAARSAKHFPLQFMSNFIVNHQPQLATLGNRASW